MVYWTQYMQMTESLYALLLVVVQVWDAFYTLANVPYGSMYLVAAIVQFVGVKFVYNLDKNTLEQMNKELAERK